MSDEVQDGQELPAEVAEPEEAAEQPEVEGEESEPTADESEEKPKGGFQKRIDELTRNWRSAERRNDQLLQFISERIGIPEEKRPPPQPEGATPPPSLEQYGYDEAKYTAAMQDYARKVAQDEVNRGLSEFETKQATRQRQTSFQQKERDFAAEVPDYAEKVYDQSLPITTSMAEIIADSDLGPQIAYHLANHRDDAYRIANMTPTQAAREIGRIEASLSAPVPSKPPKEVTKAPPPPPKVKATEGKTQKSPDDMSVDEWLRWRNKQLAQR